MTGEDAAPRADVWLVDSESIASSELDAWADLLSPDERQRAARFLTDAHRRDFVAAHGLARRALSRRGPSAPAAWRFGSVEGKPFVAPAQEGAPPLRFSISHARGLVACAVTRAGDPGIDVERIDRPTDVDRVARRYFAPAEVGLLRPETPATFFELWTLKEAVVKAEGRGIAGFEECSLAFAGSSGVRLDPPRAGWYLFLAAVPPLGRLALAVRTSEGSMDVSIHTGGLANGGAVEPLRWTENLRWRFDADRC